MSMIFNTTTRKRSRERIERFGKLLRMANVDRSSSGRCSGNVKNSESWERDCQGSEEEFGSANWAGAAVVHLAASLVDLYWVLQCQVVELVH